MQVLEFERLHRVHLGYLPYALKAYLGREFLLAYSAATCALAV